MTTTLAFLRATWGANLRSSMDRRAAFVSQAALMLINNFVWLTFWVLFFGSVSSVNGWKLADVGLLYGMSAAGFGLSAVLFGGALDAARRIQDGSLDSWLLRPRSAWLQAATARTRVAGWGDLVSALILLACTVGPDLPRIAIFGVVALGSAAGFVAFFMLAASLAFWSDHAEGPAQQAVNALITFSLYPSSIFGPKGRILLHVLLPAGLVSWAPVALVRHFDLQVALLWLLGTATLLGASLLSWRFGLKRYEGG